MPVFEGNKITPQMVRTFQPTFSGAFIAHIEATVEDEAEKNQLCAVIPMPNKPEHWMSMLAVNLANQQRWGKNKELRAWIVQSRLDAFSAMARAVLPTDTEKLALLQRYAQSAAPAAAKLQMLQAAV